MSGDGAAVRTGMGDVTSGDATSGDATSGDGALDDAAAAGVTVCVGTAVGLAVGGKVVASAVGVAATVALVTGAMPPVRPQPASASAAHRPQTTDDSPRNTPTLILCVSAPPASLR